ncbi:MAG: NTP transferase domain-containing protein [Deltaproteobacteria bacterium]|nr:NTP transferase domain-containing protein [Deltaproteobacteria bacterium]
MVGTILAGGTGSRLFPLTKVTNKHLLPVGPKPMIFHPVEKLVAAGIRKVCVVTGTEHMGAVVQLLGSGRDFGCEFTYRVQDEAGGIAQALMLARHFVGAGRVVVLLGDNIFEDPIGEYVERFRAQERGARVLLREVPHPERFGVARVDDEGRVLEIVEKPKDPPSNLIVTGIYMYDAEVFEIIPTLRPSGRGELEITDVNNEFLRRGTLRYDVLRGWWTDAGTFESLAQAGRLVEGRERP